MKYIFAELLGDCLVGSDAGGDVPNAACLAVNCDWGGSQLPGRDCDFGGCAAEMLRFYSCVGIY